MIPEEKEQAQKIRLEIDENINYIQKHSLKELKRIFSFISDVSFNLMKKNDIEKTKKIIRKDKNLAEEFIKEIDRNTEIDIISNSLKIDHQKAYAKLYLNCLTLEEIEKIAIKYNPTFNDFIFRKTGKELNEIYL